MAARRPHIDAHTAHTGIRILSHTGRRFLPHNGIRLLPHMGISFLAHTDIHFLAHTDIYKMRPKNEVFELKMAPSLDQQSFLSETYP